MARAYAHLYGLAVTGLRFFTVYGPWGRAGHGVFCVHPQDPSGRDDRDMIKLIEEALGREAKKRLLPAQPGDVGSTWADIDEHTRDTGFSPSIPLSVGIRQLVDWYRDYYKE